MARIPDNLFNSNYRHLPPNRTSTQVMASVQEQKNRMQPISLTNMTSSQVADVLQKESVIAQFTESSFNRGTYTSFSGADVKVTISFQGASPVSIGEAQTVTYSLFRPITPVYNLGDARPAGYVRGERTVAGSIIFTVFDRNVLLNAFYNAYSKTGAECANNEFLTDELPPFDIHLTFLNEYGQQSYLVIHDVHVTSEGQVMSIEDMITENTLQYLATDVTLMRPVVNR